MSLDTTNATLPPTEAPIFVDTVDELWDALDAADGGETIVLAPGDYGQLDFSKDRGWGADFAIPLTIVSQSGADMAVFSGMSLRETSNLTIQDVVFDYTYQVGDAIYERPFEVTNSTHIVLDGVVFDGDVANNLSPIDDGYGYAIGLSVRGSTDVAVVDSTFHTFHRGMTVSDSDDVHIAGNNIHGMRMDGINVSAVQGITIEGNWIHDFIRSLDSADHSDMIQFWTAGTTRNSADITIRNNLLDIGAGDATQSIFMRNERVDRGEAGEEMFYSNVVITGNVILNGHLHGIALGEARDVTIAGNLVVHDDGGARDGADDSVEIPRISVAAPSVNVSIAGNVTHTVAGHTTQGSWNVVGNTLVQDQNPDAPLHLGDLFLDSSLWAANGVPRLPTIDPNGALAGFDVGGPSDFGGLVGPNPVVFNLIRDSAQPGTLVLDATASAELVGAERFVWTFADGTTADGLVVARTYAQGGQGSVRLDVLDANGDTIGTAQAHTSVKGWQTWDVDAQGRLVFDAYGVEATLTTDLFTDGVDLTGSTYIPVGNRSHLQPFHNLTAWQMDFTYAGNGDTAAAIVGKGDIMRVHGVFVVAVDRSGNLTVSLSKDAGGTTTLRSQGFDSRDGVERDVAISVIDGVARLSVDGVVHAQAEVGRLDWEAGSLLAIGNPWNQGNFAGRLLDLAIHTDRDLYGADAVEVLVPSPGATVPTLQGTDGDDVFQVGVDTVRVLGGAGRDRIDAEGRGVDLADALFVSIEDAALTGPGAFDLWGTTEANRLVGNADANRLDGRGGADTLVGGAGNDTYVIHTGAERIEEAARGGRDTVVAHVDHTLAAHVEDGQLAGDARVLTGNTLANLLVGTDGADTLDGGAAGKDTLVGGQGDDLYTVRASGYTITETDNGGVDTVQTWVTHHMSAHVENGRMLGTATTLKGNALGNQLSGNLSNNTISGVDGDDLVFGNAGDDTVLGGNGQDVLHGGDGADSLRGDAGNDVLRGGNGNDQLFGGTGNDTLWGDAGNDTLTGGQGNDVFVFGPNSGHDTVTFFVRSGSSRDAIDVGPDVDIQSLIAGATDGAQGVVLALGANDSLTLVGVQASDLTEAFFV